MIDEKKLIDELIERKNNTVILMARHGGKWFRAYHQKMIDMIYDNFIETIKKQPKCARDVPMKLKRNFSCITIHDSYDLGECPNCGKLISNFTWNVLSEYQVNYCQRCGQRLDWNEENYFKKFQKVFIKKKP